jgi:hypothetical protein
VSEDFEAAIERMRVSAEHHYQQWNAWVADKPQSQICQRHHHLSTIDFDRSLSESAQQKRNLLFYRPCPKCPKP